MKVSPKLSRPSSFRGGSLIGIIFAGRRSVQAYLDALYLYVGLLYLHLGAIKIRRGTFQSQDVAKRRSSAASYVPYHDHPNARHPALLAGFPLLTHASRLKLPQQKIF
jgi:hypothetical protein